MGREVRVVDRTSKNCELEIKEALHIQMTPDNNKFNRDIGLELSKMLAVHAACKSITLQVDSKRTLQKSCCFTLCCYITTELTPEEDFGKKLKRQVKF